MRLDRLNHLPAQLLDIAPREIRRVFPHPTLITVEGRHREPLFLATVLHGNETTSFYVLQDLARRYAHTPPPRSLMIFVGNVDAAEAGVRRLPGQHDFNRIWAGGDGPLFELAQTVLQTARDARPFASIDIHNNTGTNPHYGCVNSMRPAALHLAALFSRIGVYYRNPLTTQSLAFTAFCPAVTIECGRPDDAAGVTQAINLVDAVLHMDHLPERMPAPSDLTLYETVGRVVVDEGRSFSFGDNGTDLALSTELGRMNFSEMPAGAIWGHSLCSRSPLRVYDENDVDLTDQFFSRHDATIQLTRAATPAMITPDLEVIRQDCLCYLMQPLPYPEIVQ
ncbi:peptidase M14 [Sinimarinibacterium sp. CAU 1509]|uniref:M14 family metallopeptidase n=1 Tax=Sinimarinibacterium sp. CAU 1509 TaxID=2562283 RepID=UPI0010AB8782|nr:M14 family metallopeptidase [Sinimarinibacterium sp. CAU 1509]TJY62959.1 peptidase M14 [Sinimarinibacterium sp. CAU 1509]